MFQFTMGGPGNDALGSFGLGVQDFLWGSGGADNFNFMSDSAPIGQPDYILDFNRSQGDKIVFGFINRSEDAVFIGAHRFTGEAGEVRFNHGKLSADANGDGHADFSIRVLGVHHLHADDLIFF